MIVILYIFLSGLTLGLFLILLRLSHIEDALDRLYAFVKGKPELFEVDGWGTVTVKEAEA